MAQFNRRQFFTFGFTFVIPRPLKPPLIPGVPEPKFWFGDRVRVSWEWDDWRNPDCDGSILWQAGDIIGLFWSFDLGNRWRYQIYWDEFCPNLMPHFKYEDDHWESELELVTKRMMP